MIRHFFNTFVLAYPKSILIALFLISAVLGTQAFKIKVDASAETLLLENDKDLQFTRIIAERYHTPNYLVIAYTPENDLLAPKTLKELSSLSQALEHLSGVDSVTSILNVPLMKSPAKPIKEMLENIPTLASKDINFTLAKEEFLSNPIYAHNLVSSDFKTTALMINLKEDKRYKILLEKRNYLRLLREEGTLTPAQEVDLSNASRAFDLHRDMTRMLESNTIESIRTIMDNYRDDATLFLGGASMISNDMVNYVKQDLKTYGSIVLILLIIVLWIVFREVYWVLIPVTIVTISIIATLGLLGMLGWEITVISSNFISLQLIISMSIIIHLVVRYRELSSEAPPEISQRELVLETVTSMSKPTFFAVLTTIAGFTSLIFSNILPIINLGLMMSVGIVVSLILSYLIFPCVVLLIPRNRPKKAFEAQFSFPKFFANATKRYGTLILVATFLIIIYSLTGASKLRVENSFINYFKSSTEIYQGMVVIDQQLGGTTPLDIIIDFPPEPKQLEQKEDGDDEFSEFDDFEEEFSATKNDAQYWFTSDKMHKVSQIHNYLESLPEVGKVLSLGTMLELGRSLNDGKCLDNFQLALLHNELPPKFKEIVLDPYISIENNQTRFALRIVDSNPELRRDALLHKIKDDLVNKLHIKPENIHLSNIMVLYNNMLQSLFSSQILTLGIMVLLLSVMFFMLFKSLKVTFIAMVANLVPVSVIFGFMGHNAIPLDMMTITIAAISVGIAVDNTIHYIYRYKIEFAKDHDYLQAMQRSHESIGYAMTYTSIAIMIGFMILVLSSFIPTIYFGLLTVLSMFMAILADLMLLPKLILLVKPFGKGTEGERLTP